MKVPFIANLWCISVILLATLQSPSRGQQFFLEEQVTEGETTAREENESSINAEDVPIPENIDDVSEGKDVCSRYSPKEVFHTVVNPHLFKILDEMSTFVEAVLHRIGPALHTLTPYVDQSPVGKLKIDELFLDVQTFMLGAMRDVYSGLRQAWRELIIAHINEPSSPHHICCSCSCETQSEAEEQLVASLQEFSIIMKAVVFNSIHVIEASLSIPNNTADQEAALAISQKLPKIAPNFLGTLIYKLLKRSSDIGAFDKIHTSPLRSIIPLVEKMHAELNATISRRGGTREGKEEEEEEEEEAMEAFWRAAVEASHHHLEEWPLLDEDFHFIYSNEEYLSEVLLQLINSF
ncbi:uncharacterized protein LOC123499719 isoform X2 [Portunus trituberculatus]|uniref:uncharacterized protein LOC123499719 isoform X2 n=1 Tax=Portunus trituberculatus TaxID=210409 RepID=UPI001E1D0F1F|nr:uncharacterized protein LOC123499719 isoform X2 [Portunus trituberculatus]